MVGVPGPGGRGRVVYLVPGGCLLEVAPGGALGPGGVSGQALPPVDRHTPVPFTLFCGR